MGQRSVPVADEVSAAQKVAHHFQVMLYAAGLAFVWMIRALS